MKNSDLFLVMSAIYLSHTLAPILAIVLGTIFGIGFFVALCIENK